MKKSLFKWCVLIRVLLRFQYGNAPQEVAWVVSFVPVF